MSKQLPHHDQILEALREEGKPMHAGALAKACGVEKLSYRNFADLLQQMADQGVLKRDSGNRFRAPKPRTEGASWQGVLSVNARGFGFVNAAGRTDVFVPPERLGPAMHGDTVLVEVSGQGPKGVEGSVIGVVTRRNARVAGTVHIKRKSAWLEPDDTRLRGPIVLTCGAETEDGARAEDGDAAVVEITRFPESITENPEGQLLAVLGKPGEARVEVEKIKVREQIEEEHPPAAIAEAEKLALSARKLPLDGRTDLRHVHLLTIDPKDARDHDDAVFAEKTEDGYRVYIAIADVSHYVREGTALDAEALRRGCTIYLPDRAIPMLPSSLAADLCSLLPEQERYCLCVIAELDAQAQVQRFDVVEGLMRAAAMITYDSAARTLGFTELPPPSPQAEAFKRDLKALAGVAVKLRQARMRRGALDFDLPEPQVELDAEGGVVDVRRRAQDPGVKRAYQIVEELMLLANELVARWLITKGRPTIYRVHGRPDEEKLSRLAEVAELLGAGFDLDDVVTPKGLSQWLGKIATHDKRNVLEGLLLRSLKQASYDINNIGHFGLASEAYLHFTSPIRRYPDLLVHRMVRQVLHGQNPGASPALTEALRIAATQSSARERSAMSVEREVVDLYRALLGRKLLGEIFEGKVGALVGGGVFVSVESPYIEIMIPYEGLGPDRYELSDDELSFVGTRSHDTISLGDMLSVEVVDSSILRRTIYGRRLVHSTSDDFDSPARGKRPQRDQNGFAGNGGRKAPRREEGQTTAARPGQSRSAGGAAKGGFAGNGSAGGRSAGGSASGGSGGRAAGGRSASGSGSGGSAGGAAKGGKGRGGPARAGERTATDQRRATPAGKTRAAPPAAGPSKGSKKRRKAK